MVRRVTLREVAQEAQVSVAAASLVLNNKPSRISQRTQQRIRDVAKRLQYVVNENARGLVTNETRLIALIVPDIENMFSHRWPNALNGMPAERVSTLHLEFR